MAVVEEMVLELFVKGQSARSNAALELVRRVCEKELHCPYRLDVIDINQDPQRLGVAGIIATPALVRHQPKPVLRTVGRLDEQRVRQGLGLDE